MYIYLYIGKSILTIKMPSVMSLRQLKLQLAPLACAITLTLVAV